MKSPFAWRSTLRLLSVRPRCENHYGAPEFGTVSLVRWQNTKSKSKSVFYRASGFELGTTSKDVWNIMRRYLRNEEEDEAPEITVLPACASTRKDSSVAIIKFPEHRRPAFLAELDRKPSGGRTMTTRNNNGHVAHITVDRHFHGFTQLYPIPHDTKIRAE